MQRLLMTMQHMVNDSVQNKLVSSLGVDAGELLRSAPFNKWSVTRSFGDDPEKPSFDYIFSNHGLVARSDENDRITVIFLFSKDYGGFDDSAIAWRFFWGPQEVRLNLGSPSKSAGKSSCPILGDSGPWDRFDYPKYSLHFEYGINGDQIVMITLMRSNGVPQRTL